MPAFAKTMHDAPDDLAHLNTELLRLSADASEDKIHALAEHGATLITEFLANHADALPRLDTHVGERAGAEALTDLMNEHMTPAQQRVMTLIIERLSQKHQ